MKRILAIALILCMMACGCTVPQNAPALQPIVTPQITPGPTPEPTPTASPVPTPTASPELVREHLGRTMDEGSVIRAGYTGGDDGLFEAVYRALTERFWADPAEAMRKAVDDLPEGTSGSVETDFSFRYNRDTDPERFEKRVLEDMDLAYITEEDIDGGLLILFDIKEDGSYIPFLALELDYRKDSWFFREYGGERWLIREHAVLYGTGLNMVQCDWYNLDRGGIPISYLCQATEASEPPCPLGNWGFSGELSQWQVREEDGGFAIEMEATHQLERYNAHNAGEGWLGEELTFSGSEPLRIHYDFESGEALAEGMEQWYFQIPDGNPTTEAYRLPFQTELREAAAGEGVTALWAEWVLNGGDYWRDYFAEVGLKPPE